MIILYDSKTTDFNNNGLVVLSDCISCNTEEELNGLYELVLEYPLDECEKWKQLLEGNITKVDGQLFRVYHKAKILKGIKINARHIFYDLLDNFLEDIALTNLNGAGALDLILTNTQYAHSFTSLSDVSILANKQFIRKNVVESIMGTDGLINNIGGELVRDNFNIKLLGARGLDRGVLVAYGKNVQGIEETLDTDGICTRLMPVGKDGLLLTEKYIDSQYINNFSHPKIKVIELSDYETEVTLRAAAISYMANNKIDIPQFNYKIDFLELSKTEEYKNYAVLERVYLGDTVTIKHNRLDINLKAKVIKITKNILTDRIEKIELGSFKPNLATTINNSIQEVKKDIVNTESSLQLAIDNATTQINSALGGYVMKRNGELLIMDTEDPMTATKVWRWNQNGLGYSGTGYNGPFGTAITADGHIVADFIDTGVLRAVQVIGGTIDGVTITGSTITSVDTLTVGADGLTHNPQIDFAVPILSVNDASFNTNVWLGVMGYGNGATQEYDSFNIEVKSPANDNILNNDRAKMIIKGKGYGDYCDLNLVGNLRVNTPGGIFIIDDSGNITTNGGAISTGTGNINAVGGVVSATTFNGSINASDVDCSVNRVDRATDAYEVNAEGDPALLISDNNNYCIMDSNGTMFGVIIGGNTVFQINSSGTKTGGTIVLDGKNWGMSPVDSPKILISDLLLDQEIKPEGTEVFLDEKLSQALNGYAVFPSRSDVVITNKKAASFIVSGTGSVDLYIIGKRIGEEEVYWVEMAKPEII